MPGSRRVRGLAAVGALAVVLELAPGASEPAAEAAPRAFTIVGGGWGHGIGMSQYEVRSASAAATTSAWSATGMATAPGPRACSAPAAAGT
jgi:hypothetical protein